jgi:hypothetical protein
MIPHRAALAAAFALSQSHDVMHHPCAHMVDTSTSLRPSLDDPVACYESVCPHVNQIYEGDLSGTDRTSEESGRQIARSDISPPRWKGNICAEHTPLSGLRDGLRHAMPLSQGTRSHPRGSLPLIE